MQDSKAQITAIHLIIGTLQKMHVFGVENRDTLTHKATGVIVLAYFPAMQVTRVVANNTSCGLWLTPYFNLLLCSTQPSF